MQRGSSNENAVATRKVLKGASTSMSQLENKRMQSAGGKFDNELYRKFKDGAGLGIYMDIFPNYSFFRLGEFRAFGRER